MTFKIIPNLVKLESYTPVHQQYYDFLIGKGVNEELSRHIVEAFDLTRFKDGTSSFGQPIKACDGVMNGIHWTETSQGAHYWHDMHDYLEDTIDAMWQLVAGVEHE